MSVSRWITTPRTARLLALLGLALASASLFVWSTPAVPTTAASSAWPTYQHDVARSGVDPDQPAVGSAAFDWSVTLDGQIYAQPLVVGNTVIAATENDSIYAIDATSHAIVWRTSLGTPATAGLPSGCGDPGGLPSDPVGVLGTPVIDTTNNVIYAAALTAPGGNLQYILAALNLSDGSLRYSVPISPVGSDPSLPPFDAGSQDQRSALTLSQGRVYVEFGGVSGDCGNYRGWVWAANASDGGSPLSYETPAIAPGAGIWNPPGASVDAAGNLYVATGNSKQETTPDHSESVIRLGPSLQEASYWTASDWLNMNTDDADTGSFGPLQLANPQFSQYNGLLFQAAKSGMGWLLDSASLHGVGSERFGATVCGSQIHGGAAYVPPTIYLACSNQLEAVQLSTSGSPAFTVSTVRSGYTGHHTSAASTPIWSGGRLWNLDIGAQQLVMIDPLAGQQQTYGLTGQPVHFAAPSAGAGHIFAPAGHDLDAFLLQAPQPTPTPVPVSCPCFSLWPSTTTPTNTANTDTSAVELGVKFTSDQAGFIAGVRFYKGAGNTGPHVGNLWTSSGTLLASAMFSGETATGWQQVTFSSPVAISANTTYVASYFAPNGHYAGDLNSFTTSVDQPPLHAPSSAASGGNGVYAYSPSSTFPASSYQAGNYWVDVVFTSPAGGGPTSTPTPTPTSTGTSTSTPTATATATPTSTSTPPPASTDTPTPTSTATPTATGTAVPASTATPTSTSTATPLPTSTSAPTETPTATPLPSATETPTSTAVPTSTNTAVPTNTSTPLPTGTATPAPTSTTLPTATSTSAPTATNTTLPTPTSTSLPVPTSTPTPPAGGGTGAPPPGGTGGAVTTLAAPYRLADTRLAGGPIAAGQARCFGVAGQAAIPATAIGVVLNVTGVGYAERGWLTVYPGGEPLPATSTLNVDPSAYAIANGTFVRLGSNGQVCVAVGTLGVSGRSDVVLDATGYLTTDSVGHLPLLAAPQRVADTRTAGGPIQSGQSRCFSFASGAGVPSDAAGVVLNVTAVSHTTRGWLSVYPKGSPIPATSSLNFDPAAYAVANGSVMRLGTDQSVCVAVGTVNGTPGYANVVLDLTGYLTSAGLSDLPLLPSPQRLVDTRTGGGPIPTGQTRCFTIAGAGGLPATATQAVLTVTAVGDSAPGWLTIYPAGQSVPATSTLNFDPHTYALANSTVTGIGAGGQVCVAVGTINGTPGSVHVILDATGAGLGAQSQLRRR